MDKEIATTEERILEAAKKVFHTRGFEGARMQEIADEAGVNKALVHYYFRNKDTLFKAVFEDAFGRMVGTAIEIFYSEQPFTEKIGKFLDYFISYLLNNSYLPMFILSSIHERPERLIETMRKFNFSPGDLMTRIHDQVRDELHQEIDPFQTYVSILALCIFPIVARPMIQSIFGLSDEQMNAFYENRKTILPEFILNALKGYENQPGK